MIVKKTVNPKKSVGKEQRIRGLTAYIRTSERTDRTEKCVYAGAQGFISEETKAQTKEIRGWITVRSGADEPGAQTML